MKLSIISFTANGAELAQNIYEKLADTADPEISLYYKCSMTESPGEGTAQPVNDSIYDWTGGQMEQKNAILFIGAAGIAVRAISPFVKDKLHDSPVLVMDEKGRFIIPLLSGHVGGANELALILAEKTGAEPVITTATDINNRFAIDVFARKNNLSIYNKDGIKKVSSRVLAGERITIAMEDGHLENPESQPEEVEFVLCSLCRKADVAIVSSPSPVYGELTLLPRQFTVGIGCRKGKEAGPLKEFFEKYLAAAGLLPEQVKCIASIDLKADEEGILSLCRELDIPFKTFTADELNGAEGEFTPSEYVRSITGVDNICERAAVLAAGEGAQLVLPKQKGDGMTLAIAEGKWSVRF